MQVNNNSQQSFQGLKFKTIFNASREAEVKNALYSKLPKEEVDTFFRILDKSPVETTLGLADEKACDRLDAMVYYKSPDVKRESFEYIEEGKFVNLFKLKPRQFVNKVLMKIEAIEETFQIGRYAG